MDYRTVLMADDKGRITIPVKVRELLENGKFGRLAFNFDYNYNLNEIKIIPLMSTKDEK